MQEFAEEFTVLFSPLEALSQAVHQHEAASVNNLKVLFFLGQAGYARMQSLTLKEASTGTDCSLLDSMRGPALVQRLCVRRASGKFI